MSILLRLLKESSTQILPMVLLLFILLGASLFEILSPILLGNITDAIVQHIQGHAPLETIFYDVLPIIVEIVALYIGNALCAYGGQYKMATIAQQVVLDLRIRVSHRLHHMPLQEVHHQQRGDLLSRVTVDLDNVAENLQEGIPGLISSFIGIMGAIVMMIYISPILGGLLIVITALGLLLLRIFSSRAAHAYLQNQESLGAFNSGMEEVISGKSIVDVFQLRAITETHLESLNKKLFSSMKTSSFIGQVIYPLVTFLNQISYVIVAIVGGILVLNGKISLGNIQAFFLYVSQISEPISRSSYIITRMQETISALHRIYEVIDLPEEIDTGTKRLEHTKGTISFHDVTFSYRDDEPLLENISFTIPHGQMAAIVGPTGAGKTTIVNLIMRFFDIQKGSITIDGMDITEISRSNLYEQIGMVLQDAWLFSGTIAENIAYSKPHASREEIIHVAQLARADHFIRTLPNGYDTIIHPNGEDLSQGQKQLLTIARAFLANPTILILDEATASVDSRTEVLVQQAMSELLKGRTSIVIAHRLSTIQHANLLLVVHEGRIIEQGTHEELLVHQGHYAKLYEQYRLQTQYIIP